MARNELGEFHAHNIRRWTQTSRECYKIGCTCSKCLIPDEVKANCKMKPYVLELVRRFGVPKDEEIHN